MIDITNLKNAYKTLQQCYNDYENNQTSEFIEYIQDSCIKRFEYTLEIAWKSAKKILKENFGKKEEELSMNNIFRFMEGYGYAKNWESWREYYKMRNNTAHEYDIKKSKNIISVVPKFLDDVKFLIDKIDGESND